jgi:hypothetical protein
MSKSENIPQVITTDNGSFKFEFDLYTSGEKSTSNEYLASPVQKIFTSLYPLYSDEALTNEVGDAYYSGQLNNINNKICEIGEFVVDLKKNGLGSFTAPYSYIDVEEFETAAPIELLNNSILSSGTGNFAFAQGDLIITNSFGLELVQILYYKKIQ